MRKGDMRPSCYTYITSVHTAQLDMKLSELALFLGTLYGATASTKVG
jgi:hypothetical protein